MGRYEISSLIAGIGLIIVGVSGTYAGNFVLYLVMTSAFFDIHMLYLSLLCCSLVFSLEEFKEQSKKIATNISTLNQSNKTK